ncbi:hypothetical protein EJ07DRAFT_158062 [Lizonia empirigonia]|nr:hypothetical protein EJ07DRAFT_158062 [Lizonia empirigonia]
MHITNPLIAVIAAASLISALPSSSTPPKSPPAKPQDIIAALAGTYNLVNTSRPLPPPHPPPHPERRSHSRCRLWHRPRRHPNLLGVRLHERHHDQHDERAGAAWAAGRGECADVGGHGAEAELYGGEGGLGYAVGDWEGARGRV